MPSGPTAPTRPAGRTWSTGTSRSASVAGWPARGRRWAATRRPRSSRSCARVRTARPGWCASSPGSWRATTRRRRRCWWSTGPAGCRPTPTRSRRCCAPIVDKLTEKKPPDRDHRRRSGRGSPAPRSAACSASSRRKVLGQFDPFHEPDGRLLLVAPNIVHVERELEADPHDFRLWVCLHEETHRVQFTAVPWMRDHLFGADPEVRRDHGAVRAARGRPRPGSSRGQERPRRRASGGSLLDLVGTPEQRELLDGLTGVMSLLEGHADVVMDGVGPTVIPSVAKIRAKFNERRKGVGVLDRLLRRLLGLDAKMAQYRDGAAFVRAVVDKVGMAGFNVVWEQPEHLPTKRRDRRPRRLGGARAPELALREPPPVRRGGPGRRTPDPGRARGRAARRRAAAGRRRAGRVLGRAGLAGAAVGDRLRGPQARPAGDRGDGRPRPPGGLGRARRARRRADGRAGRRRDRLAPGSRCRAAVAVRRRRPARRGTPCSTSWSQHFGAIGVLLGHTLDDQAETVLLGLARGSGGRSLAGMRRGFDHYRRPLLDVTRTDTVTACQVEGIEYWNDPHNIDPTYARVRVRRKVLPVLEDELGPGVAGALARTADQLRADIELLDQLAAGGLRRAARRRTGSRSRRSSTCRSRPATACSGWPRSRPARSAPSCSTSTSWPSPSCCRRAAPAARSSCPAT